MFASFNLTFDTIQIRQIYDQFTSSIGAQTYIQCGINISILFNSTIYAAHRVKVLYTPPIDAEQTTDTNDIIQFAGERARTKQKNI